VHFNDDEDLYKVRRGSLIDGWVRWISTIDCRRSHLVSLEEFQRACVNHHAIQRHDSIKAIGC
jgi:hypothetical protein